MRPCWRHKSAKEIQRPTAGIANGFAPDVVCTQHYSKLLMAFRDLCHAYYSFSLCSSNVLSKINYIAESRTDMRTASKFARGQAT
jgi:hypothetical protein